MPVEIEAKMTVESFEPVRARLTECGARPAGVRLETNVFFDTEDRSLLAADEGLRLRRTRDVESGEEHHVITYKGPRQLGPLKSREELELEVLDATSAAELFARLGYVRMLSFEKKRETWELDGCKIELDELPHIGRFVEVEGPSEAVVMKVRETIGLSHRPIIKAGYASLVLTHLQERGDAGRTVTFNAKSG